MDTCASAETVRLPRYIQVDLENDSGPAGAGRAVPEQRLLRSACPRRHLMIVS